MQDNTLTDGSPKQLAALADVQRFIASIPALQTAHFRWKMGLQGFKNFEFGARAGPAYGAEHLAHEVAHAVELSKDRWRRINEAGWGLKAPSVWVYNRFCVEPNTSQMAERECRVAGIQKHLMEMSGLGVPSDFIEDSAHTFTAYLPDWYCGADSEKERLVERAGWIEKSYQQHTPESITQALEKIIPYLAQRRKRFEARLAHEESSQLLAA